MSLGVIEGVAEAANSILKIVSGRLADRTGAPKPLVLAGYGLSSMVRPFIALASSWLHVLVLRFTDRLGKGIRTSPRDAMLATFADSSNRGRCSASIAAMDHAGAVMGRSSHRRFSISARRLPDALRAHAHTRHHRRPDPVARARHAEGRLSGVPGSGAGPAARPAEGTACRRSSIARWR